MPNIKQGHFKKVLWIDDNQALSTASLPRTSEGGPKNVEWPNYDSA
jgi:hypothetical protein